MSKLDDSRIILDALRAEVKKKMKEDILVMGNELRKTIPRTSTGILSLDLSVGGGLPLNQWVEVVGQESSGKTALCLAIIAHHMRVDPEYVALWCASEEFVVEYAQAIGVDMDRLWVIESNQMEEVTSLIIKAVDQRAVDAVVIDSLPALVTETEVKKDSGDASVATGAQILSRFFKKSAKAQRRSMMEGVEDRDVLLIAINQWRDKIGVTFGDPQTTPGGKAKNYYYFIRMEVRRDEWLKEGESIDKRIGQTIAIRIFKNKTYRPHQYATVDFYFADSTDGAYKKGEIDHVRDVVNTSLALELFEGMYKWKGERIARKKDDIYARVLEDVGLYQELYDAAIAKVLPHLGEADEHGVRGQAGDLSDDAHVDGLE